MENAAAGSVTIACNDCSRFEKMTDEELFSNAHLVLQAGRRVHAGTLAANICEDLKKVTGLDVTTHGLLADQNLERVWRPTKTLVVDWMHTFFQDGAASIDAYEVYACTLRFDGKTRADYQAFLRQWTFPLQHRSKGNQLHRFFDDYRERRMNSNGSLVGSASEQFQLYPLLRYFVQTEVRDIRTKPFVESFLGCCKIVDILKLAKAGELELEDVRGRLVRSISEFMAKHKACYQEERLRPKHHWMYDVALSLPAGRGVVDMFIHERLHLRVKPNAEQVRNTRDYEHSVLALALCAQINDLLNNELLDRLEGKTARIPEWPGLTFADKLMLGGRTFFVGDIVFNCEAAGVVLACMEDDSAPGKLFVAVELLTKVHEVWAAPP